MPARGHNKTNKDHRNGLKNEKRKKINFSYTPEPSVSDSSGRGNVIDPKIFNTKVKKKKQPVKTREQITGVIYDPVKKRVNAAMQANPIARLFTGIKPKGSS